MPDRPTVDRERSTKRQRQLLEELRRKKLLSEREELPRPREDDLPLSFAQRQLWFLDRFQPNQAIYNIPAAWKIVGDLNIATLAESLTQIVSRHEVLRTTFFESVYGEPVQRIDRPRPAQLPILDLSSLPHAVAELESSRLAHSEAVLPFDLEVGPLLRTKVVKLNQREHLLLCTLHQTIADSWSIGILARELAALYEARSSGQPSSLPPLPIRYAEYAIWQRELLTGEILEAGLAYWRKRLAGVAPLELPTDRPRPPVQVFRSALRQLHLDASLLEALKKLCYEREATLFMTLLAAVQVLLSRWASQDDFAVGTLVAGRNRPEIEGLIGHFSNTLVFRGDLSGEPSFGELLSLTRQYTLEAFGHQDIPFERLVEELGPDRDLSRAPLFQVMFTYVGRKWPLRFADLFLDQVPTRNGNIPLDLAIQVEEAEGSLVGSVEFRLDLFDAPTVDRLLLRFALLLQGIAARPDQRVSELSLLSELERAQLLREWNDTAVVVTHLCLHDLFTAQAARTSEAIALIWETQRISYRELDAQSNRLARYLCDLGVGPEVKVGVYLQRSSNLIVTLLAVLKAGGAYVPLDPNYPIERLRFVLEDSRALLLISSNNLSRNLQGHSSHYFLIEEEQERIAAYSEMPLAATSGADNLAYVIYTSGSTGRPKGVEIEHRSASMLVRWASEVFSSEELDGVLASTSISFDLSVFELFVPLALGGTVILAENALSFPTLPAASEVTLVNTVPSAMAELLRMGLPPVVKVINLAGEALSREIARSIYNLADGCRVLNLYGPSEDTTYSTSEQIEWTDERSPSIGRAITGKHSYILDQNLALVPIGTRGELFLGGAGLARGYLGRPDLTAERFLPNPFGQHPGLRLYRTGDLARHRPDGRLEYLGRIDHQINSTLSDCPPSSGRGINWASNGSKDPTCGPPPD